MHLLPVLPLPLAAATVEAAAATIFTFVKNWERKGLKEKSRDFSTAKNAIILK